MINAIMIEIIKFSKVTGCESMQARASKKLALLLALELAAIGLFTVETVKGCPPLATRNNKLSITFKMFALE